jgi:hypothetical protein
MQHLAAFSWLVLCITFAQLLCAARALPPPFDSTAVSTWSCATLNETAISPDANWTRTECSGETPLGKVGPMIFNIVRAGLSGGLALVPAVSSAAPPLQPLTLIAAEHPGALAGINGGYFWRVDDSTFVDNVCWTKSKAQALAAPGPDHPSCGVGDSAVVINSTIVATNCEDPGYARPAALICDGANSKVIVQRRAELLPPGTRSAIAAGPNLVSSRGGSSYVDIPLDDFNVNIWEHASNTAGAFAASCPSPSALCARDVLSSGAGRRGRRCARRGVRRS